MILQFKSSNCSKNCYNHDDAQMLTHDCNNFNHISCNKITMLTKQKIKQDATIFLSIVITLVILGVIFVYSSSSFYALEKFGSPLYYVQRQSIGIALGILFFFIAYKTPLSTINHTSLFLCTSSLLLTAMPLISQLTKRMHGSSRWLNLFGFIFQPSE